jgi:mono/diheme cytochrome c family protein
MRIATLLTLTMILACDGGDGDSGDTSTTTDTSETGDTSTTTDTSETGDTGDSADTSDTADTADTADTSDTADTADTAPDLVAGQAVFTRSCGGSGCHGTTGDDGSAPNLSDEVPRADDSELTDVIRNGKGDMPAITLTDIELRDLLAWLRATFP